MRRAPLDQIDDGHRRHQADTENRERPRGDAERDDGQSGQKRSESTLGRKQSAE
jgi:hypothetical protein